MSSSSENESLAKKLKVKFSDDDGEATGGYVCFKGTCSDPGGHQACMQRRIASTLKGLNTDQHACYCSMLIDSALPCDYCRVRKAMKKK